MDQPATTLRVQPDDFIISNRLQYLEGWLHEALAVCVHDGPRALGGLLHLRLSVRAQATADSLEPTDNTLSSDLLLLETFCRQLHAAGGRRTHWHIRIFCHSRSAMETGAAATVSDLVQAYFSPSPRPVECRRLNHPQGVQVRLLASTGQLWVQAAWDPGRQQGLQDGIAGA